MFKVIISMCLILTIATSSIACTSCHAAVSKPVVKPAVKPKVNIQQELIKTAISYNYVRESQGDNRSPQIDMFLKELGLPVGLAWCLAYIQHCWKETCERTKTSNPMPKGVARVSTLLKKAEMNPYVFRVKSAKSLMLGASTAKVGDMTIHISGVGISPKSNFNGHIEAVTKPGDDMSHLYTIGGNTGPQPKGGKKLDVEQERNAGGATAGVHQRYRSYAPTSNFRIEYLIEYKPA